MSRYTIELRSVCDMFGRETVEGWFKDYDLTKFLTAEEIETIEERGTWSKDELAEKIVNHYFMHEIGFETPALFRHNVKFMMKELMEEYLPLIYSAAIKYDPLVNVDFTETYTGTDTGNTNGTSNSTGLVINSDTPQGNINKQDILAGNYATSTAGSENDTTSQANSTNTTNSTKTTRGNSGVSATAQHMVQQYRDNIRAIDREIINKLNVLFMGIY